MKSTKTINKIIAFINISFLVLLNASTVLADGGYGHTPEPTSLGLDSNLFFSGSVFLFLFGLVILMSSISLKTKLKF